MTASAIIAAACVAALPLAVLGWLVRRVRKRQSVSRRASAAATIVGGLFGVAAFALERTAFHWLDLSLTVNSGSSTGPLLTVFLFVAPLEESLKALVIWPLLIVRKLRGRAYGVVVGVASAAGFAATESAAALLLDASSPLGAIRFLLMAPAHLFCTGLVGYAFGSLVQTGQRWVGSAWFAAVVIHGLYAHIVLGRGPGFLPLAAPLLIAMAVLSWGALRQVRLAPHPSSSLSAIEPPSLQTMRSVLRRSNRPLMIHWIFIGALVNVGVAIGMLSLAVYLGHRWGLDFAAADETDMKANGPVALLGLAVLAGFPIAGYLVARASHGTSVLEAAFGASLALFIVVAMLSVAAPIAILFALAVAPVAFALACGGAWFGIR